MTHTPRTMDPVDGSRRAGRWTPARLASLFLIGAIAWAGGCQKDMRPKRHPVRGQVMMGDKPIAEASVVFHPLTETSSTQRPVATTDQNGNFTLTTFDREDGAPVGDYAITLELRAPRQVGEETVRDGRNLLPTKYARPETTSLRYRVVEGENLVPPLVLSSH